MTDSIIVSKIEQTLAPESFEVTPFAKPRPGDKMQFEVNLVAESLDKMRKVAIVEPNLPSWGTFSITCDEGLALGGDDTAPPPLGYLASGIAFCLLTHLSSFIRAKNLNIDSLRIEQRLRFATSLVTEAEQEADLRGECLGLETYVLVDTEESEDKIQELMKVSEQSCMALQAIVNRTPQSTRVFINGNESA